MVSVAALAALALPALTLCSSPTACPRSGSRPTTASTGHIIAWVPLILFGLSMDYHVFLVTRIREAAESVLPTRDAVREGADRSAGVITSAAVVMIAVFAVFGALRMTEMKQMGIDLAVAVAIDAFAVRVVVLPALMTLLGRANWWPSRPSRKGPGRPDRRVASASTMGR